MAAQIEVLTKFFEENLSDTSWAHSTNADIRAAIHNALGIGDKRRRKHENMNRLSSTVIAYSFLNIQKEDYSYMLCVAFQ
jgi:hypothetical protein